MFSDPVLPQRVHPKGFRAFGAVLILDRKTQWISQFWCLHKIPEVILLQVEVVKAEKHQKWHFFDRLVTAKLIFTKMNSRNLPENIWDFLHKNETNWDTLRQERDPRRKQYHTLGRSPNVCHCSLRGSRSCRKSVSICLSLMQRVKFSQADFVNLFREYQLCCNDYEAFTDFYQTFYQAPC